MFLWKLRRGALAVVVLALFGSASGVYDRSLDNGNGLCLGTNCANRPGISGAMWFGPRLGRRRRSEGDAVPMDDEQMSNTAIAPPYSFYQGLEDKRHTPQFTPRLGRELGDEVLQRFLAGDDLSHMLDNYSSDVENYRQMSSPPSPPPFAPRLGRHLPFSPSPRLGRRLPVLFRNF